MSEIVCDRNLPPVVLMELPTRDGTTLSVDELRERFFASEYGQYMYGQSLRFSQRYGYDRTLMRQDLGGDVCPVGHQYELTEHLQKIVDAEQENGAVVHLSDQELAIVAFACSIHDIGECEAPELTASGITTVGDIPFGNKTDADRANEAAVRAFFYDRFYSDVDPAIIGRVEAIIAHKDKTLLHTVFEAAHEVQTWDTVARAEKAIAIPDIRQEQLTGLSGIVRVVKQNSRESLQGKFSQFALIERALELERL